MRWSERAALAAALVMAGGAGPLDISQPWAPPARAGQDVPVYLTLDNEGDVPDTLLRFACVASDDAALVDAAGQPATVTIGPRAHLMLAPGGAHGLLRHVSRDLAAGELLPCTATFEKSGERLMEVSIRPEAPPPPGPL
jgi:copper(I)-binding protein